MANLSDIVQNARRPERKVPLCLRGDLTATVEQLERELREADARSEATQTLSNPHAADVRRIAQQIEDIRAEMETSTVMFHIRGLSQPEWDALVVKHPPRDGDSGDRMMGFNRATFNVQLVRACLIDPVVDSDAAWDTFVATASAGQLGTLARAAEEVSAQEVTVPFSLAGSLLTPESSDAPA